METMVKVVQWEVQKTNVSVMEGTESGSVDSSDGWGRRQHTAKISEVAQRLCQG